MGLNSSKTNKNKSFRMEPGRVLSIDEWKKKSLRKNPQKSKMQSRRGQCNRFKGGMRLSRRRSRVSDTVESPRKRRTEKSLMNSVFRSLVDLSRNNCNGMRLKKKTTKNLNGHFTTTTTTKLLQSCPTLCDPIDGSPTGSPVHGILQARTLEWVAISFSNA